MLSGYRRVPAFVKQQAVTQHAREVGGRRVRTSRRASQVVIAADPFVAARGDLPARLANPVCEICLVPLGRTKRFVQRTDAIDAGAPYDPWANDNVNFLKAKPVSRPRADRALQPAPVRQILPSH